MRRGVITGLGVALLLLGTSAACALGGDIQWMPEGPPKVSLGVDFDLQEAHVTSRDDRPLDLRGWSLRYRTYRFNFPSMTLEPWHTVTVTNGLSGWENPPRYIRWKSPNLWTWPYDDRPVELYDANGNVLARYRPASR